MITQTVLRQAPWVLVSARTPSSNSRFSRATIPRSMAVPPGESSGLLRVPEQVISMATHSNTYATARSTREISSTLQSPHFTAINLEALPVGRFGRTVPLSSVITRACDNRRELRRLARFPQLRNSLRLSQALVITEDKGTVLPNRPT